MILHYAISHVCSLTARTMKDVTTFERSPFSDKDVGEPNIYSVRAHLRRCSHLWTCPTSCRGCLRKSLTLPRADLEHQLREQSSFSEQIHQVSWRFVSIVPEPHRWKRFDQAANVPPSAQLPARLSPISRQN